MTDSVEPNQESSGDDGGCATRVAVAGTEDEVMVRLVECESLPTSLR